MLPTRASQNQIQSGGAFSFVFLWNRIAGVEALGWDGSMQKPLLFLAVGLVCGTAIGFTLGHSFNSSTSAVAEQQPKGSAAAAITSAKAPKTITEEPEPRTADEPVSEPGNFSVSDLLKRFNAVGYGRGPDFWRKISELAKSIPKEQIPAVVAELAKQQRTRRNEFVLSMLLGQWAETDTDAARAWVSQLPAGALKNQASVALVTGVGRRDPRQALAMIGTLQPNQAQMAVGQIFYSWAENDPQAAAAQLATLPQTLRDNAVSSLASAWAGKDPQAALDWVSKLPANTARKNAYAQVLGAWVSQDPHRAMDYLEKMPESPERTNSIQSAAYRLLHNDPSSAVQLVSMMPVGEQQDGLLSLVASTWMGSDPEKTLTWAKLQTDEHVRSIVWPAIASGMAATDPRKAADLALSLPEDTNARRANALGVVATRWAESDAGAAASYFQALPENESTKRAISILVNTWADNDPGSAARWMNSLPAGGKRDAALQSFAMRTAQNDPANAGQLAMGISDSNTRGVALSFIARSWTKSDPDAAARWMAQPGFPPELRGQFQTAK